MSEVLLDLNPPSEQPSHPVSGRRATALIAANAPRLERITASPVEVFRSVALQSQAVVKRTRVYPNHVVQEVVEASGEHAVWTFFAAAEAPWTAVLIERGDGETWPMESFDPVLACEPCLDYAHCFAGTGEQGYERIERGLALTVADHPELMGVVVTDGVIGGNPEAKGVVNPEKPLGIPLSFESPKGFVVFLAGKAEEIRVMIPDFSMALLEAELDRVSKASAAALEEGVVLTTPDATINRFFQENKAAFHKAVRRLPVGTPFTKNPAENLEVDVLAASAGYPAVEALGSVQSLCSALLAAPSLQPIFESTLEILKQHAKNNDGSFPAAVGCQLGEAALALDARRAGQHPQWIAAAATLVLLTGDRELGERLWPGIEAARKCFKHSGDNVNLWDDRACPPVADTAGYTNGMLYAQAWWVWACERALEVARFLNKSLAETTLRLRYETAKKALAENFEREGGYGAWRAADGSLHPFSSHSAILPVALGLSDPARAKAVFKTLLESGQWRQGYGPKRANTSEGISDGDSVYLFMRWNFVSALLAGGQVDLAMRLASQWAGQELSEGLAAPTAYTVEGLQGAGDLAASERAMRALSLGLFGIRPMADGLYIAPQLPKDWKEMALDHFIFRGRHIRIKMVRTQDDRKWFNGRILEGAFIPAEKLQDGANILEIHTQ